ncbi:MAG TPA: type II toxin-antitoxin system VapB family antitoxin [Agromyces sp.]|nr:type II toxin-antitoxin system VapB family antitoxin [Agromyces sp.]
MVRTTVFRNNRTQAVRLPKDVALPEEVRAVDIVAVGNARVITPAGGAVDFWYEHGTRVSVDFLAERDQPAVQERSEL